MTIIQRPKLVILDRDGVINFDSPLYIKNPDEWHAIPGSLESIAKLKQHGYLVCVATNQSGVARGLYSQEILDNIHNKMTHMLSKFEAEIDKIFFCPHHPDEACKCRKPQPGMLLNAMAEYNISPEEAIMVGDRDADKSAAHHANVRFFRVHQTLDEVPHQQYSSLADLTEKLLLTL